MARLADFVAERSINLDALFTNRWKLSDAVEAYQWFDHQSSGKGLLVP
jgi:threonine dehydrogenase-like Zn-dependent dehydrogenase